MASIDDVARVSGVARSTVSYVLSGKRSISPATRERVQAAVRELGYRPHAGARALASSRTSVLALVIPLRADVDVAVVMAFVASIATEARRHDHDVLLLTADEGPDGLRRVAGSAMCDAVLVMEVEADEPRVPVLRELGLPAVLIGVPDDPQGLACVDLDFAATGAVCVDHLADLGHREVALLAPSPAVYARGTGFAVRFLAGFTGAAERRGAAVSTWPCSPTTADVERCLDEITARRPRVTGLVVHNEAVLGALLAALHRRGIVVPTDLSVVAVCADEVAAAEPVPLTSVALPIAEVSRAAVQAAVRQLDGSPVGGVRLVAPHLTARQSTAPPGQRRAVADTTATGRRPRRSP